MNSPSQAHDKLLCVDLQATCLTVVRYAFHLVLLIITVTRLIMEIRVQWKVHVTYKGNVNNIVRFVRRLNFMR